MLKNRLVRRERRQEREMLKKLDQEARTAKRELLNAKMKLKTAMKRMKNVDQLKEVLKNLNSNECKNPVLM